MTTRVIDILRASDTHTNRPAATAVPAGSLYECSTHNCVYRSDGTTWATWAYVAPAGSSDGHVLTWDATAGKWKSAAASGGGGGSSLLARTAYNPATQSLLSTGSATPSDVDATNLSVSFTMPTSGQVSVILDAFCDVGSGSAQGQWNLREGSTDLAGTLRNVTRSTEGSRVSTRFLVTGSAGASRTLKWGYASYAAASHRICSGAQWGASIMEVWGA